MKAIVIGARTARETLLEDSQIDCAGYTDREQALAKEQPDAVALCSP
jgi:predicted dehydrogenase